MLLIPEITMASASKYSTVEGKIHQLLVNYHRQSPNKIDWNMEKTWPLNPSRSKTITTGIDIAELAVRVSFGADTNNIAVNLSAEELKSLLTDDWMSRMQNHLDSPKLPGDSYRVSPSCLFSCEMLKNGEPGLKLTRFRELGLGPLYVYLGAVSVRELISLQPAITARVEMLQRAVKDMKEWLIKLLDEVKFKMSRDLSLSIQEKEPDFVRRAVAGRLMEEGVAWDREGEFRMDMLWIYDKQFHSMLKHYVHVM